MLCGEKKRLFFLIFISFTFIPSLSKRVFFLFEIGIEKSSHLPSTSRRLDIFLSIAADLPFLTYLRPCQLQSKRMLGRVCARASCPLVARTTRLPRGFFSLLVYRRNYPFQCYSPLKNNNNNITFPFSMYPDLGLIDNLS